MTENLQNNDLIANENDDQQAEEVKEELIVPQETSEGEDDKKEEKPPIPDWAAELRGEFDNKFNQLYQIVGNVTQPAPQTSSEAPVAAIENDETAKKVTEIIQRMEEEKAIKQASQLLEENISKARQKHKDFDEKVNFNPEVQKMQGLVSVAIPHKEGMDILYHLVTEDKERFEKMKRMTPVDQIREFGKIEALLEKKKAEQSDLKTNPQVPEPLSMLKNSGIKAIPGDLKSQMETKFRKKFI